MWFVDGGDDCADVGVGVGVGAVLLTRRGRWTGTEAVHERDDDVDDDNDAGDDRDEDAAASRHAPSSSKANGAGDGIDGNDGLGLRRCRELVVPVRLPSPPHAAAPAIVVFSISLILSHSFSPCPLTSLPIYRMCPVQRLREMVSSLVDAAQTCHVSLKSMIANVL